MKVIKMAIVGAGTWGANHAKIYKAHPFAEIVAICDTNRDRAEKVAQEEEIPFVYTDYNEMFAESDCDAVAIVTPDFAHADIAVAAANAKKHILIEKPLATTREDALRILEAVDRNGVRAMVDLHNRWNPPFHAAYQAVQSGDLGRVYSAYFRLNDCRWVATDMLPWAAKSSVLWFLGSHSLDTLMWMFNSRPKRVYAVSTNGILKREGVDTIDEYLSTIEFENGAVAQMENGWVTPNANPCVNDIKFNLLGDKGMIAIDASNHNMIQKYTDTQVTVPDVIVQNNIFGQPKGFAFESIRAFVDCLISGKEFPVTIKEAAYGVMGILAIMQSAKTRTPVCVEYEGL
ncbi:MAG: Gfo/Idh/MocA family protein [Christensenellales bacterium]